jgi:hypothetical protein
MPETQAMAREIAALRQRVAELETSFVRVVDLCAAMERERDEARQQLAASEASRARLAKVAAMAKREFSSARRVRGGNGDTVRLKNALASLAPGDLA